MGLTRSKINVIFLGFMLVVFIWAFIEARQFAEAARFFPLYISAVGIILLSLELAITFIRLKKQATPDGTLFHPNLKLALKYMGWVGAFLLCIYIIGFKVASALFLLTFLKIESNFTWFRTVLSVALVVLFLIVFGDWYLNLNWPKNLLNF
ncbi:tripartite tricarboxylate transporter TctB family protein [Halalkalibacter krulwichiae]|uniref:DUF1468 domain-containing protein n=1 Tax=Halalkalibacter krulwichiae TaxID=199441 RepID=A0A1X9MC98_9BACI|nr:tripartite tricarboxylate transporter TctB family protein [Halalkalibacter krulwichiae]ARK29763.1 hypothetical protein BkAM31D_07755 [Halalkalibacter krulwichiae]